MNKSTVEEPAEYTATVASRRDFLKRAGKLAAYTPPAMVALMNPAGEAIAGGSEPHTYVPKLTFGATKKTIGKKIAKKRRWSFDFPGKKVSKKKGFKKTAFKKKFTKKQISVKKKVAKKKIAKKRSVYRYFDD